MSDAASRWRSPALAALALTSALACGAPPPPAASVATAPCPAPPDGDPRADALVAAASAALAAGDRAAAATLLATLADDDEARALAAGLASLARDPLPRIAPGGSFLRSSDRRFVVSRVAPDVRPDGSRPECPELVLRRVDLERGEVREVRVTQGPERERLAALTQVSRPAPVRVTSAHRECPWPRYDPWIERLAWSEPMRFDAIDFVPYFVGGDESCGLLEALSPRGRFAIVTTLVARPLEGGASCVAPARPVVTEGAGGACLEPRARLVDLETAAPTELGVLRFASFSPDERLLYVRSADAARLIALDGSAPPVALPAHCTGPSAFSLDGTALATTCGDRVELRDLASPDAVRASIDLAQPELQAIRGLEIAVVGVDAHAARGVVVTRVSGGLQLAVTDGAGRVTHYVGPAQREADGPRAATTRAAPRARSAAAAPRLPDFGDYRSGGDGAWRGESIERPTRARAIFVDDWLYLLPGEGRGEAWRLLTDGPGARVPMRRWVRVAAGLPAVRGEPFLERRTGADGDEAVLRFENVALRGARAELIGDHSAGPTLWVAPPDRAPGPVGAALRERTNLRVCPDDLRVVPVLPAPAPDVIWAPPGACAAPPEPPARAPNELLCTVRVRG